MSRERGRRPNYNGSYRRAAKGLQTREKKDTELEKPVKTISHVGSSPATKTAKLEASTEKRRHINQRK